MAKSLSTRALVDSLPDIVGELDGEYRVIQCNAAGYDFFGGNENRIVGEKFSVLMGQAVPVNKCAVAECYRAKTAAHAQYFSAETGEWLSVKASPLFDVDNEVTGSIIQIRDITKEKKVETRLLMLERALNQSIDGIAVADMAGINRYVNPAWAQTHGYTVEEMLGSSLYDFHPEEQLREKVIPFFDKVLKDGSNRDESEHTKKDGTIFSTWMMANIIRDDKEHAIGIVGTIRDISKLKRAEKELQQHRNHLETLVEDRTSQLTMVNKQLSSAISQIQRMKDQLEAENVNLREEIRLEHNYKEIIGQSDRLMFVLHRAEEVAQTDSTVLILGQTGTGKELVARAIHNNSTRKSRPLVKVDCSALPTTLIESELFGHEKGAFSGAIQQRKGRFEVASGSTLFLDEIGELAPELQSKLLRVLEYGEFERIGSSKTRYTDIRVIAATNRNLKEEVDIGRFREDLWYRLNVFLITMPALKDRIEDIPLLAEWFVARNSRKLGKQIIKISPKTMSTLQEYHWPGNIRELANIIESAMISSHNGTLHIPKLPKSSNQSSDNIIVNMAEMEKTHIIKAIEACRWKIEGKNGAAELLDLNPGTLRGRMRKYGIERL